MRLRSRILVGAIWALVAAASVSRPVTAGRVVADGKLQIPADCMQGIPKSDH